MSVPVVTLNISVAQVLTGQQSLAGVSVMKHY